MKIAILCSAPFLLAPAQAQSGITPPMGSEILLDGKCAEQNFWFALDF